jgi:protease IV
MDNDPSVPPPLSPPPRPVPPPLAADPRVPRAERKSFWKWILIAVVLIGGAAMFLLPMAVGLMTGLSGGGFSPRQDMIETVIAHAEEGSDKIVVIPMEGVIMGGTDEWTGQSLVSRTKEQLQRAEEDDDVRAVILRVDSPGGEVLASDEIYKLIAAFQKNSAKPVIASMGSLAASGGYYVSAPCRWIVANDLTITGSIGVIMAGYNWRGLLNKIGVQPQVFKSGQFKDMLSPDKEPSEISAEEKAMVQALIDETYERFSTVVAEGRAAAAAANNGEGRALVTNWKEFADGRVFSGKRAFELGYVDELGNFDTAVERALTLADVEDATLVQYVQPPGFAFLRLFGKTEAPRIELDLGIELPPVRPGRLYFLSPTVLR